VLSKTNTGRSCIEWGTSYPQFTYTTDLYTSSGLESNYCRNPGTDAPDGDTIWCFIDEQGEWEYCALPNNTESSDFFEGLGNCVRESDGVQADIGLYTTD